MSDATEKDAPALNYESVIERLRWPYSLDEVAAALGVSTYTVRVAGLAPGRMSKRNPPQGWQAGAIKLLQQRIAADRRLLERLLAGQNILATGKRRPNLQATP